MITRKKIRYFSFFFLLIFTPFFVFLVPLDRTPYQKTNYYYNTINRLDSLEKSLLTIEGDTLKVGWGRSSLIPNFITPLAGYGSRKGAKYQGIEDSIWTSVMVFDNGISKAAYISLDLLIVPSVLNIESIVDSLPIESSQIFFTASHSHSSIGGFLPGLAGKLFAGDYNPKVIPFISNSIRKALMNAIKNLEIARIGFTKINAGEFITNRLVGDSLGISDPWIRVIKVEKKSGKKALLFTYSAHATCYGDNQLKISSDYPGKSISILEKLPDIDFAIYGAGSVGSMAPFTKSKYGKDRVDEMALGISNKIILHLDSISTFYEKKLTVSNLKIEMMNPSFKLNKFFAVRPWVFNWLSGDTKKKLSFLKLGNTLMVGTPCDFSGELAPPLDAIASKKNINLIINSFNGGYVGYITKDEWYDKTDINTYETYTMNWFGPNNGSYFSELIESIIDINAKY